MNVSSLIVIPARMTSSRFPNKPLANICGMSMIERVWRIACLVSSVDRVVIATDSHELYDFSLSFGAEVLLTNCFCRTGTDRVAEASRLLGKSYEIVFSLQGDAVLTPPWVVEAVLKEMKEDPKVFIATPAVKLEGKALSEFVSIKRKGISSGTSVVFNAKNNAMYFSKGLIPFIRDNDQEIAPIYRHIGLYGYRKDILEQISSLPEGTFEKVEKLEQLRALENGIDIRVVVVDYRGRTHASVDRPEDVQVIERIISEEGELVL